MHGEMSGAYEASCLKVIYVTSLVCCREEDNFRNYQTRMSETRSLRALGSST